MATYKKFWKDQYAREAEDWHIVVERPLFDTDGKWTYGGPSKADSQLGYAIMLAMSDAPVELVHASLRRAHEVIKEVERLDLLNTHRRHIGKEISQIYYLRSKVLLGLMEGGLPAPDEWRELARLKRQLFDVLKSEGTPAPDEKFRAVLYLLLAHDYAEAKRVMDNVRSAKGYELELSVLKALTAEMAQHGAPVQNPAIRAQVLDFFDQIRNPTPDRVPGQPYKKFDKSNLDRFEWGLLVAAVIEPGDGQLDARRALELVSQ